MSRLSVLSTRLPRLTRSYASQIAHRAVTHPDTASPETAALIAEHSKYLLNTYARPPLLFTRGKGCKLYSKDTHGEREYLDFTSGIAVNALGHGDEQIAEVMHEQALKLSHSSNVCWNEWAGELAKLLINQTRQHGGLGLDTSSEEGGKVFFSNSGTEANEGAIKFTRLAGKLHPQGGDHKTSLVCFNNAFHGRSMGPLSLTPNPAYQAPFAPLVPNVRVGELNDISALDKLVDENVCGVFIEPIQGEGGVGEAKAEFLEALGKRCREVGAVLVYDEIQCGLFRTGKMWAHSHLPAIAQPDIVTMAKPLANGFPIGAIMVRDTLASKIAPGMHGTTFGGQPLATRVAHHVITRLSSPSFLSNLETSSKHLDTLLSPIPSTFPTLISAPIRGRGLMRGIPFIHPAAPGDLVKKARERGVLLLTAGKDAVRLVPSLTVTKEEIEQVVGVIESCLGLMIEEGQYSS